MARLFVLISVLALLAGCGGGSSSAAPAAAASPAVPASPTVVLSGQITFDLVPAVAGRGLDYAATVKQPARGVTVELLQGGAVTASTTTDTAGNYSFANVPQNTDVALRVRAEMLRVGAPSWDFRVVDNVNDDALYTLAGAVFNSGAANLTRNLHAPSGWGGSEYTAARSAAPFAILDVAYDAVQLVLTAAPTAAFPALRINWSPANVPVVGTAPGEIGTSRYRTEGGIFLVGAADDDTDEYDRHVIAHEFGHYLEHSFARSDSFGGPHALFDQLDIRVAFGEAWGSAFAGMVTRQETYVDTLGDDQKGQSSFSLEQTLVRDNPNPGWFNEESLQSLLFDLYDDGRDVRPNGTFVDDLALGFGPIWSVLTNQQRNTRALTSVFSFVNALKSLRPADQALIDGLTTWQSIGAVTDDYGSGQTNFGHPTQRTQSQVAADFSSIYDWLPGGGTLENVCSLDDYTSRFTGAENKLASRRFVRFTVTNPGPHVITARATAPLNAPADPDLVLHLGGGQIITSEAEPSASCSALTPASCVETFTTPTLAAGDYVLEVYEWSNATDEPIGRTCFDVTVTR